jgi:hypothetical protein
MEQRNSAGTTAVARFLSCPPSGGKWIERVLYSFGGPQGDLVFPLSTLTLDTRGNLYGTASGEGT